MKKEDRMNRCSMMTCRNCPCFKREKDGEEEDLRSSDQCQKYIDNEMSESDNEDVEDEDEDLEDEDCEDEDSEYGFSEIDDLYSQ